MTASPQSVAELQDAVRAHARVVARGGGTKSDPQAHGAPHLAIDLARLTGVSEYSPDECVLSAAAGTPIREIEGVLAPHRQYLPFDPPLAASGATIGGTVAAGLSGSGRYRYGGVRDFVIGVRLVDGNGTAIRSGGKVVKNAAGFLLHHGMVGSEGRFGILTEITLKVFPEPEARATLRAEPGSLDAALDCVRSLNAGRFDVEAIDCDAAGALWIRVAGRRATLVARLAALQSAIGCESEILHEEADRQVWDNAREFAWVPTGASLVKVPITPSSLRAKGGWMRDARFICGGSLAWVPCRGNLPVLSKALSDAGLSGLVVRGPGAGALIGVHSPNAFEERVRRVLDPGHRFGAAPDTRF